MSAKSLERHIHQLLDLAAITVNGPKPWDIHIHDDRFYARVLAGGSRALGETYMDGWWDCERLDAFFARVLKANLDTKVRARTWLWAALKARAMNMQTVGRTRRDIRRHYDLGNHLYRCMLDKRMIYSCGYWSGADSLDQAQENKLELVARKLCLQKGMRVLDIGCGWGGAARYLAERHGVEVVGITISPSQAELAQEVCADLPVEIRLQDYRECTGTFDRIYSIGMFEHVGYRNHRPFMDVVRKLLRTDGLFVLHTIGGNTSVNRTDAWIDHYIFPGSMLPSAANITVAAEGRFVLEDWHGFGPDYDRTLMAWHARFNAHWDELKREYDDRFRRMWNYYLLSCAGSFRARKNQVWQLVLSPEGVAGGYQAPRLAEAALAAAE